MIGEKWLSIRNDKKKGLSYSEIARKYNIDCRTATLIGIALLFGIGNAFDSIVSLVAYAYLLKKQKINIGNTE